MEYMFHECFLYTGQGIGAWDTSAVTNMHGTFMACSVFVADIGAWDTSAVTTMKLMFYRCEAFQGLGIGDWDLSAAVDMQRMFERCPNFGADLSSWALPALRMKAGIFEGCDSL